MKYALVLILLFVTNDIFSQESDFDILGKELAKSIVNNDSALFYSLVLPKEAVIQKFKIAAKGKLESHEIETTIKKINSDYDENVSSAFGFSFFNLTTKADIFNLDLKNIEFEVVETGETKIDTSYFAIQGRINHDTYSYLTFYASDFEGKLFLASHLISISENNKFEERERLKKVELSADENGNLISQGRIELEDSKAAKKDIVLCIKSSPFTIGLEGSSETSIGSNDFEQLKGQWVYSSYVNNSSDFSGMIEFKYHYTILDGIIDYKYYDFIHSKDSSVFESIGILPYDLNETVLKVFNEEQYQEIMDDIYLNQVIAVKRTKEFTDKCFK